MSIEWDAIGSTWYEHLDFELYDVLLLFANTLILREIDIVGSPRNI